MKRSSKKVDFIHHHIDTLEPEQWLGWCSFCVGHIVNKRCFDIVIQGFSGLAWYKYPDWTRRDIHRDKLHEVGLLALDLTGNGWDDLITEEETEMGREVVWYERPADPLADEWKRHPTGVGAGHDIISARIQKESGEKCRAIVVGPVLGELYKGELREEGKSYLYWAEIPKDPREDWKQHTIDGGDNKRVLREGTQVGNLAGRGRSDVLYGNVWYECPANPEGGDWVRHEYSGLRQMCRAAIGDINKDGKLDIVLVEGEYPAPNIGQPEWGKLAWYENMGSGKFKEHSVGRNDFYSAHSLGLADFTGDGTLDIFVGEIGLGGYVPKLPEDYDPDRHPRVIVYYNDGQGNFEEQIVSSIPYVGTHEAKAVDVNGNGMIDIIGKDCVEGFEGSDEVFRSLSVDWWENTG
jgi:hypothetical protein